MLKIQQREQAISRKTQSGSFSRASQHSLIPAVFRKVSKTTSWKTRWVLVMILNCLTLQPCTESIHRASTDHSYCWNYGQLVPRSSCTALEPPQCVVGSSPNYPTECYSVTTTEPDGILDPPLQHKSDSFIRQKPSNICRASILLNSSVNESSFSSSHHSSSV